MTDNTYEGHKERGSALYLMQHSDDNIGVQDGCATEKQQNQPNHYMGKSERNTFITFAFTQTTPPNPT